MTYELNAAIVHTDGSLGIVDEDRGDTLLITTLPESGAPVEKIVPKNEWHLLEAAAGDGECLQKRGEKTDDFIARFADFHNRTVESVLESDTWFGRLMACAR